jgi:AcrR family transcriptional regulator
MNHIVTLETNQQSTYAERRAAMADETRTRILDACVAILARGVAELSIPAVAREAGVSVPTVYRNFADKKTLLHETAQYLRSIRKPARTPDSVDELPEVVRQQFLHYSSINETVRAALASEAVLDVHKATEEYQRRVETTGALLAPVMNDLTPREREHAALMVAVLCSSATCRAFRDVAGASPEQAAETVAWTISRLLRRPWKSTQPTAAKPPHKTKGSKR